MADWRGRCVRLLALAEWSPDAARTWREGCKGKLSASCSGVAGGEKPRSRFDREHAICLPRSEPKDEERSISEGLP
jgi:hypothetical protein